MDSLSIGGITKTGTTATINVNQGHAGQEYTVVIYLNSGYGDYFYYAVNGQLYWIDPVNMESDIDSILRESPCTNPSTTITFSEDFVRNLMECRFSPMSDGKFCTVYVYYKGENGGTYECSIKYDLSPRYATVATFYDNPYIADPVGGSYNAVMIFDDLNGFYEYSLSAEIDGQQYFLDILDNPGGLNRAVLGTHVKYVTIDSFHVGRQLVLASGREFAKLCPNKSQIDIKIVIKTVYRDEQGDLHFLAVVASNDTIQLQVQNATQIQGWALYDTNNTLNQLRCGNQFLGAATPIVSSDPTVGRGSYIKGLSKPRLFCYIRTYLNTTLSSVNFASASVSFTQIEEEEPIEGSILYEAVYDIPDTFCEHSSFPITVSTVDSRGLTATLSETVESSDFLYTPPEFSGTAVKCTNDKSPTASIKSFNEIEISYLYKFTDSFEYANDVVISYDLVDDETGDTVGSGILLSQDDEAYNNTSCKTVLKGSDFTAAYGSGGIDIDALKDYTLRVTIYDGAVKLSGTQTIGMLKSYTCEIPVQSPKPIFDFGENSFNLNVDLLIKNESIFSLIYPVGAIYTTARDNVPECFSGTWTNIGSTPQGSVTMKYFQRTE